MAQGVETRLICGRDADGQVRPFSTDASGIMGAGITASFADREAPFADTAASVTYGPIIGTVHVISGVAWSYSDTPTDGRLYITDGAATVFDIDITCSGPGFIPFSPPKKGTVSQALVVNLTAGGAGIYGKLNVLGHWVE